MAGTWFPGKREKWDVLSKECGRVWLPFSNMSQMSYVQIYINFQNCKVSKDTIDVAVLCRMTLGFKILSLKNSKVSKETIDVVVLCRVTLSFTEATHSLS